MDLILDEHGHLADHDAWSDDVAVVLGERHGIGPLTETHWRVIRYLRQHYLSRGELPMMRRLCRDTQVPFRRLHALFPPSPARAICRLAGLPPPEGCVQQPGKRVKGSQDP